MKEWQIENSETSEISKILEILFQIFLFPSFQFCPIAKIENSDLKISEKNFRVFQDFRVFRVRQYMFWRTWESTSTNLPKSQADIKTLILNIIYLLQGLEQILTD